MKTSKLYSFDKIYKKAFDKYTKEEHRLKRNISKFDEKAEKLCKKVNELPWQHIKQYLKKGDEIEIWGYAGTVTRICKNSLWVHRNGRTDMYDIEGIRIEDIKLCLKIEGLEI